MSLLPKALRNSAADPRNLLILLSVTVLLRLWGITYGLPVTYNSTEYFIAKHALSFGARKTVEPLFFIYPTFFTYSMALLYGLYFATGYLFGAFHSPADFAFQFVSNPYGFYLIGRLWTAFIMVLAIFFFYKIVRRFHPPSTAFLWTLGFLSLFNIQFYTRWMVPDAYLVLGTVLVFQYIHKWNVEGLSSYKEVFLPGLLAGLTISSKYNAGFLALALLTAIFINFRENKTRLRLGMAATLAILFGFLIGTPYWLIKFRAFLVGFQTIWSQSKYVLNVTTGIPYLWEISEIMKTELLLGIVLVSGIGFAIINFRKAYLPHLSALIPTFLLVGSWEKKGLDYLLVIFPVGFILTAAIFAELKDKFSSTKLRVAMLIVLLPSLAHVGYLSFLQSRTDTRQLATEWIISHIPPQTPLCYDHYHYDLDLLDVDRFLKYGSGSQFLAREIKDKISRLKSSYRNYRFISPIQEFEEPEIPDGLNEETRQLIQTDPFLREQFRHPYKSLEELKQEGARWLIINSETYQKFLRNPLPPLANPLRSIYEKKLSFYQELFSSFTPEISFVPAWNRPGPIIRIYKLTN